ncbi:thiol-disulfide isomerase/thioredoxin [Pedobacter africanus]|uniref:Thiol-disulfide isomerase/thioredoxin n=1 Tax=Pedobacter africanus TaxID=151894 RepID=A0ACC6KVA5_9SPHI|nr:TlpA disulfide reductase family protein [Pedobacter africanus]MDR6783264.1 thiol-disulfide isomerase/thioredoxin [Pedobacter africanus]
MKLFKALIIGGILQFQVDVIAQPYFQQDSILISGKVLGFQSGGTDNFITFSTYNLNGVSHKQAFQLKSDGSYDVKLYQPFPGDVELNFKDTYLNLFVESGKRLIVNINDDKISTDGHMADMNQLMFDFQKAFNQHKFIFSANIGDPTQPDSIFAENRLKRLNEELTFLSSFLKENNVKHNLFANWQRNHLTYIAARELMLFPFFGKQNKSITVNQLFNFIKQIPVDNNAALSNSAYYSFLDVLNTSQRIILNINPIYERIKQQNGYNLTPVLLNKIDSLSNGIVQQIMYYQVYQPQFKNVSNFISVEHRYKTIATDSFIKTLIDEKNRSAMKGFVSYNILDRLKDINVSYELKERLINLFGAERGHYLYLDFWGEWCGPCMKEMPNYPKMISAFEGKPIKFIFMTVYTPQQVMMDVKNKYHIDAEFINLTKDEVAILNNAFNFKSYPSHFLINPLGNVMSNSIGGIRNQENLGAVVKAIENFMHLKKF